MIEDTILQLIKEKEDEDEYHDFKAKWYSKNQKDEMIKDIFSFVNTLPHEDCYLIIGVQDSTHDIVGIENDENRLNTQQLTDYLNELPIANHNIPRILVKPLELENHTIDVIIIKNTNDVPIYLIEDKRPKNCKHTIHAGQIYCRLNDTNTSINKTADDYQVEKLWKKRFGLDLPIEEQYKMKLFDMSNWQYFESYQGNIVQFLYKLDPDYCMYLKDCRDEIIKTKVASYSLSQCDKRIAWQVLRLMYKDRLIKEILINWLDGGKFVSVVPLLGTIENKQLEKKITFRYFLSDSIEYSVEKLLLRQNFAEYGENLDFLKEIVIFENNEQLKKVKENINSTIPEICKKVQPTKEQISDYKLSLNSYFSEGNIEIKDDYISNICREKNASKVIKEFIDTNF